MKAFLEKYHASVFYVSWLLLNLVQSNHTGLLDDEAYYWVYSRFPDWGYFDHPPMIAILIKAGYAFMANPHGVRLFIVLMSTATLMMIQMLLDKKDHKLFYAIAGSMFLMQVGGILAVPDLPLMFFTALYFIVYKKFLEKQSLLYSVLLGLVIALMLYSKYHGILIVFFTLASFPKLLLRWQTYVAAAVAALLFIPHGLWQLQHNMPSVSYHLFERNATQYKFAFTSEYILGQIALAGPLIGWLLLYAAFKKKAEGQFEKTLRWTTIGVYATFLVATFKGRVEANWTVPAFIGLIYLAHQYLVDHIALRKWVYRLLWPSLILTFIVRIYLAVDTVPVKWIKKDEFHKTREWAEAIKDSAHGLPVVFLDSYQWPSQYWFWTGDTSFALNTVRYRRNNYNFWPLEQRLQGKKVMVVYHYDPSENLPEIPTERSNINSRKAFYKIVDSFYSHSQVRIGSGKITQENKLLKAVVWGLKQKTNGQQVYMVLYNKDNSIAHLLPAAYANLDRTTDMLEVPVDNVTPGTYTYKWAIGSVIPDRPSLNSVSGKVVIK